MPASKLTKEFIETLEREHGGAVAFVCCECGNQPKIDATSLVLFNRVCVIHGMGWHRLMVTFPDGSSKSAMPLRPDDETATVHI